MTELVKVKSEPSLARDPRTSAVLNTDNRNLENYKLARSHQQKIVDKQQSMEGDISDIKEMLKLLLEKVSK
jgi:hypothetical protein